MSLGTNSVAPVEPPLCITCAYIGTNASGDWTKYRCFAQQNIMSKNLVNGQPVYRGEYCKDLRIFAPDMQYAVCGERGAWYKKAEPKPAPTPIPAPTTAVKVNLPKGGAALADALGM